MKGFTKHVVSHIREGTSLLIETLYSNYTGMWAYVNNNDITFQEMLQVRKIHATKGRTFKDKEVWGFRFKALEFYVAIALKSKYEEAIIENDGKAAINIVLVSDAELFTKPLPSGKNITITLEGKDFKYLLVDKIGALTMVSRKV